MDKLSAYGNKHLWLFDLNQQFLWQRHNGPQSMDLHLMKEILSGGKLYQIKKIPLNETMVNRNIPICITEIGGEYRQALPL